MILDEMMINFQFFKGNILCYSQETSRVAGEYIDQIGCCHQLKKIEYPNL